MFNPRPFPKPPFTRPDLVSVKVDTSYDAVSKIKDIYTNVLGNLKTTYSSAIDSINTEVTELEKIELTKASNTASDIITDSSYTSLNDVSSVDKTPALAKKLSDSLANEVASKIVADALVNETEYVTKVNSVISKIKGLTTKLQIETDTEASVDEFEKQLFVVNDLFSPKDYKIEELTKERDEAVENLNNLQVAYDELKEQFNNLQDNILASISSSVLSQQDIQSQQEYISEIIKSAVTYNLIDVNPIKSATLNKDDTIGI